MPCRQRQEARHLPSLAVARGRRARQDRQRRESGISRRLCCVPGTNDQALVRRLLSSSLGARQLTRPGGATVNRSRKKRKASSSLTIWWLNIPTGRPPEARAVASSLARAA